MFNASYFTYDGIFSGDYGLRIASFNSDSMQTTNQPELSINVVKPSKSKRFYLSGLDYESAPTFEFTVISDRPIDPEHKRVIMSWLDGRNSFRDLIFDQPGFIDITYKCIFQITEIRYHKGECIGFGLTATFNSLYQRGADIVKKYSGTGSVDNVIIYNNSDIPDEYVYPIVKFKATSALSTGENIIIQNLTEDPGGTRKFFFKNLSPNNEVTVNNETRQMTALMDNDILQNFCKDDEATMSKKNWLRLRPGKNVLAVQINGELSITCPQYIKIGF